MMIFLFPSFLSHLLVGILLKGKAFPSYLCVQFLSLYQNKLVVFYSTYHMNLYIFILWIKSITIIYSGALIIPDLTLGSPLLKDAPHPSFF